MRKRAHLFVRGFVQGVGFRPFIYTIAVANGLKGYVLNLGDAGVEALVDGDEKNIARFLTDLYEKKPPVACIESVEVEWLPPGDEFRDFNIAKSSERRLTVRSVIPTDLSICDCCITDICRESRWHNYPFTACAQCGPRFTVTDRLPYDRQNTSMRDFPLCTYCDAEFHDPKDRRYDAQGITCPLCGPHLSLLDKQGTPLEGDPLTEAAKLLVEGAIMAVKGIGGFHIAVDASNDAAVMELRNRRRRLSQPFAVMSRSLDAVRRYALVGDLEASLMSGVQHPIVVLEKAPCYCLGDSVAPGLDSIGVMLPYTGIHLLLLDRFGGDALVMTSGNYPGKPISKDNYEALKELKEIVDYYLLHNRTIVNRCDDSVIKVVDDTPLFLRKSRGYAPSYLSLPWDVQDRAVIAVGGEFNINGSLLIRDRLMTTQHIGDAGDLDALDFLDGALKYLLKVYGISKISAIAHDLNPSFLTTRYARELAEFYGARTVPVQHHHAHLASLMAETSMPPDSSIVCITIDGVGYGTDGMAWGGEILVGGYSGFKRPAHLKPQPMPGGDLCALYPARMLAGILSTTFSNSEIKQLFKNNYMEYLRYKESELDVILKQSKENAIKTSSLGRFLDAVAGALKICSLRTYEGEPPMRLEALAKKGLPGKVALRLPVKTNGGRLIIDTSELMCSIFENLGRSRPEDIAYEVHRIIGTTLAEVACTISDDAGISVIGLSGGSTVNSLLHKYVKETIEYNKKKFVTNTNYPCGDGGVSAGQAVIASQS